jgi:hypothetical protein
MDVINIISIVIAVISLCTSLYFATKSKKATEDAQEQAEIQKTIALISLLSPACDSPDQWQLFIKYLIKHDRLPTFTEQDHDFVYSILQRLGIKGEIVNGRIKM